MQGLCFEDCGLSIGLISYALDIDGKELFKDVFQEALFERYKENINKYSNLDLTEELYMPTGYRLFGRYGLATLALIDDFAFCNRIFSSNSNIYLKGKKDYCYNSKIITGVSESTKGDDYLKNKAQDTFLRKKERYPFISIIKLKVDAHLLSKHGIELTRKIKLYVQEESNKKNNNPVYFDSIIVDCFDNDELAMVSFSNSLITLHEFYCSIRKLSYSDLDFEVKKIKKHVFTSCYSNLGYHVDYSIDSSTDNADFLSSIEENTIISIQLTWEIEPGRKNSFEKFIKEKLSIKELTQPVAGGNMLYFKIPLEEIHNLESLCAKQEENPIRKYVKEIKVSLLYNNETNNGDSNYILLEGVNTDDHSDSPKKVMGIPKDTLLDIKELMNQCRVSKIVRERFLNICKLYNDSINEPLHATYFYEIESALRGVQDVLKNFEEKKEYSISDIDKSLSDYISLFEEGFYNRFFQKEVRNNNLEYNGGIQQYLTCFDYAYKELLKILVPEENEREIFVFTNVSGYEKVSSIRACLQLNINQITYPELFATTVWKEAANFYYPFLLPINESHESLQGKRFGDWIKYFEKDSSFVKIRNIITNQSYFDFSDLVYKKLCHLSNRETMEYFVIDYLVFHFGFSGNYELFWHFYWKYSFQISQCYDRYGKIDIDYFLTMLLRLIVVAFHENNYLSERKQNNVEFIKKQATIPYDPSLSEVWYRCFSKVFNCASTIYENLFTGFLKECCDDEINRMERKVVANTPILKKTVDEELARQNKQHEIIPSVIYNGLVTKTRQLQIDSFKEAIKQGSLIFPPKIEPNAMTEGATLLEGNYLICLLNAYLLSIKELDEEGKENKLLLKSIPRSAKGKVLLENKKPGKSSLRDNLLNLPADPLGGIFIPNSGIRTEYFKYRTSFYRSLWNYTITTRPYPIDKDDK